MVTCVGMKKIGKRKGGPLFYIAEGTVKIFTGPRTRTKVLAVYAYCTIGKDRLVDALAESGLRPVNTAERKDYGATRDTTVTPNEYGSWPNGALFLVAKIAA